MIRLLTLSMLLTGLTAPSLAQTAAPELHLDLNALQPVEGACRVTFLASNGFAVALDKATFELAIFGKDGAIVRLVALDFKGLTAGKTKVMQFDLKDIDCAGVSRVLVNDVTSCVGTGIEPAACLADLRTSTATGINFGV